MSDQETVLRNIFSTADSSGNGKVSPGELKRLVNKEMGADLSDREIADMFCALDKNEDGEITEAEFLNEMMKKDRRLKWVVLIQTQGYNIWSMLECSMNSKLTEKGRYICDVRSAFREKFNELDQDSTGSLSTGEIRKLLEDHGCSEDEIAKLFTDIDTDQDGTISLDEFMVMV